MENHRRWCVALAAVVPSLFAGTADAAWVKERDLSYVMTGREFHGEYANGVKFVETFRRSGRIEYKDSSTALTGAWTIRNGAFCVDYDQAKGGCFQIQKPSDNCIEFWVVGADGQTASSWIARGWHSKYPSTCIK
jgi:hypothetical protein